MAILINKKANARSISLLLFFCIITYIDKSIYTHYGYTKAMVHNEKE